MNASPRLALRLPRRAAGATFHRLALPRFVLAALLFVAASVGASAQTFRAMTPRYEVSTYGHLAVVGNTSMTCKAGSLNYNAAFGNKGTNNVPCANVQNQGPGLSPNATTANDYYPMVNVDVDGDATTYNSSTADLAIPAGARVRFAALYWGARRTVGLPDSASRNTVRFKVPGASAYRTITATQFTFPLNVRASWHAFADVTSLVQNARGGTYTVANVITSQGTAGTLGNYAGWSLFVVLEDPSEPLRYMSVSDGLIQVFTGTPYTGVFAGFVTPFTGSYTPRMAAFVLDGDNDDSFANRDSIRINSTFLGNAYNPVQNVFNSTISDGGANVTARNPSYPGTLGIDLDWFDLSPAIVPPGARNVNVRLTTAAEGYLVHAIAFQSEIYNPEMEVDKRVSDLNGGNVQAGDVLEYTVTVKNNNVAPGYFVKLSDPIPVGTAYVPGSMSVVSGVGAGAKTDAAGDDQAHFINVAGQDTVEFRLGTGATATKGGTVDRSTTTVVRFRVTVDAGLPAGTALFNRVQLSYNEGNTGGTLVGTYDASIATQGAGANLQVVKTLTSGAGPYTDGQTVAFQIAYANLSATAAEDVNVQDLLPPGLTFVSATTPSGWTATLPAVGTNGAIKWSRASSAGNATATFTVTAKLSGIVDTDLRENTAQVNATTLDPISDNNEATVAFTVKPLIDLRVAQTASATNVNVGQTVTYTVSVTNDRATVATGVTVKDLLPAGVTFASAAPGAGTYVPTSGLWDVGTVGPNETKTLTLTGTVTQAGAIVNTAQVASANETDVDSTPNNNVASEDDQASTTVTGVQIDLSVTNTVSDASPVVGENVTFTVTVSNAGPSAATGVALLDKLPAGLMFVSAAPGAGTYDPATGVWTVGNVAVGQTRTLLVVATVTGAGPFTTTAQVSAAGQPDVDSTPGNSVASEDDQASASVGGRYIDLSLQQTLNDADGTVWRGETTTYTVTVRNDGAANATGVAVTDVLPAGLTLLSTTPSQGTFAGSTWTVGSLPVGAAATLLLTVRADADGTFTNMAQVSAAGQPDVDSTPGNGLASEDDQASTVLVVTPVADLRLSKTVSDASPLVGQNVTFSITLSNFGPSNATTVRVKDLLPTGLAYVSHEIVSGPAPDRWAGALAARYQSVRAERLRDTDGPMARAAGTAIGAAVPGSYNRTSGIWNAGGVPAGETYTLRIVATVTGVGPFTNTAEVTQSGTYDPTSTPNNHVASEDDQSSATVGGRVADVSLTQSIAAADVPVGQQTTLSIVVTNDGSAVATGVTVQERLPAGFTFVSAAPTQGSYAAATGLWTVGTLPLGGSATLDVVVAVAAPGTHTATAEVMTTNEPDLDSTPGNGVGSEDDQASVSATGRAADLHVAHAVSTATPHVGQLVTFTVQLGNDGPDDASGVTVQSLLAAGFTFVSSNATAGSYDTATGIWTVGGMPNGTLHTLTLVARVLPSGPHTLASEVTASSLPDLDSTPANGSTSEDDDALTAVAPTSALVDLSLASTLSSATAAVGDTLVYTVTLANDGPSQATGVAVSAALPAGLAFASATPSAGTYDAATGAWTVGTLNDGASRVLVVKAVATAAGTHALAAEVSAASEHDVDSTPGNGAPAEDDRATKTVVVAYGTSDVAIAYTVTNPVPALGEVFYLDLTATNEHATRAATDVQVAAFLHALPAGVELVGGTVPPGTSTADYTLWLVGTLAPGEAKTLRVALRFTSAQTVQTCAEVARMNETDLDSTPYNGSTTEDDDACVTVGTAGSSSGGVGGLESNGDLSQDLARVLYARTQRPTAAAPVAFSKDRPAFSVLGTDDDGARLMALVPAAGPEQSRPEVVTPADLLGVTNATGVLGVDYVRTKDRRRMGALLMLATENGQVYEHTKAICDRLRTATLADLDTLVVRGQPFVVNTLRYDDGTVDYAASFVAYTEGERTTVDSRFLLSQYAVPAGARVTNVQVWSPSADYTRDMIARVLDGLGPVQFRQGQTVELPRVYVERAEYRDGALHLRVNNTARASWLRLSGASVARAEGAAHVPLSAQVTLPRDSARVWVTIPTGPMFDAGFFVETDLGGVPDQLYLADGAWSVAPAASADATIASFSVTPEADAPEVRPGVRYVERAPTLRGDVRTTATLFRYLRAGGQPLALDAFRYLDLTLAGEGQVMVRLEQAAPDGTVDVFYRTLRLAEAGQRHRIELHDFRSADGRRFAGEASVLSFVVVGNSHHATPFALVVSRVRFAGGAGDASGDVPEATLLERPSPNPARTRTLVAYRLAEAGPVRLTVYDLLGRAVLDLRHEAAEAGFHRADADVSGLPSGRYLLVLEAGGRRYPQPLVVMR